MAIPPPSGRRPKGYRWDGERGVWVDAEGGVRPEATRNQRRVEQRNASPIQKLRHESKWKLYESAGRHYHRMRDGQIFTLAERRAMHTLYGYHISADLASQLELTHPSDAELERATRVLNEGKARHEAEKLAEEQARQARQRDREESERRREEQQQVKERAAAALIPPLPPPEQLQMLRAGFVQGAAVEYNTRIHGWIPAILTKVLHSETHSWDFRCAPNSRFKGHHTLCSVQVDAETSKRLDLPMNVKGLYENTCGLDAARIRLL